MGETIMTLHPDPTKQGVNIDKDKYDVMREAILECIGTRGEMPFKELADGVTEYLDGKFDGSVGWYVTTVKLDLEARSVIERVAGQKTQVLRAVKK